MGIFWNRNKKADKAEAEAFKRWLEEYNAIQSKINAELYAEFIVVEYIAKQFSKAEIKFYSRGEPKKGEEHYRWNIKPNRFQTAVEFKKELTSRLLLHNEVLIFENNQHDLIIADTGFTVNKFGCSEYTFENVSRENERFIGNFRSSNVIYLTCEETEIRRKLKYLLSGMQELLKTAATMYQNASNQKVLLKIDTNQIGGEDFEKQVDNLVNEKFRQFFNSKKNAVLPLYRGYDYKDLNEDRSSVKKSEIADIKTITDEMISKAAIAHGVKPSVILGDKEDTTIAEKETISNAIKPLANLIENGINISLFQKREFFNGNYAEVDLTPIRYSTIFDNAEASDKLVASGQYSIDEMREARGDKPLNTTWSKAHFLTKNYEFIELLNKDDSAKGGEE